MAVLSRRTETIDQRRAMEAALVAATRALLTEGSSYADLSIGRIAERAGRTRTSFYFYFRDKRDLLIKATEELASGLYNEADLWWSGTGGPIDMRVALENILRTYRDEGALLRAVVEASTYDEEIATFWRAVVERFIHATEERLIAEGASPDRAHGKAFLLVWMTERSCYQHVINGGRLDDDALVDALVDVWHRAVYAS
jgi:TetR/AcrR family transcriptional regulator, ethionamide resistance regulator